MTLPPDVRRVAPVENAEALAQYAIEACRRIARISEDPQQVARTFLAPETRQVHALLSDWMQRLDMKVEVDGVGNLRGFYPALRDPAPRLVIGSHIDTVPDAGAFDGVLGVVLGLTLIEALRGERLTYGIEVIAFSEEEGVRFGVPFVGSLAVVGNLQAEQLQRTDSRGITIEQAIRNYGLDPSTLALAELSPDTFAYFEMHIEQGPVLEELQVPLGIVGVVVGQSRLDMVFQGRSNHAGTTPMHLRRDALAGAAEWIVAVEQHARSVHGLVATVGQINASPGVGNVIPGSAELSLEVRHAVDSTRALAVKAIAVHANRIADARGLKVTVSTRVDQPAVRMDVALAEKLEAAATTAGFNPHRMTSGAGHDAMVIARKVPSAMLFLRSPGGISHHPDESVLLEDVVAAIKTGHRFLSELQVS